MGEAAEEAIQQLSALIDQGSKISPLKVLGPF
jgi:hypothetical protein